ncbi:hypothetical protein MSG28_013607 [Choristoneura fumiferana]|uniref:Uncharacterized protein n=1 Tax=Choristoneura fumiferana TaxID=7141 RepID=A0ACC0K890_CHOFU|nr:hypothetical protein MSG28_013607 [Choristoneura fumiferana]
MSQISFYSRKLNNSAFSAPSRRSGVKADRKRSGAPYRRLGAGFRLVMCVAQRVVMHHNEVLAANVFLPVHSWASPEEIILDFKVIIINSVIFQRYPHPSSTVCLIPGSSKELASGCFLNSFISVFNGGPIPKNISAGTFPLSALVGALSGVKADRKRSGAPYRRLGAGFRLVMSVAQRVVMHHNEFTLGLLRRNDIRFQSLRPMYRTPQNNEMSANYVANVPKLLGRANYSEWVFAAENFLVLEGVQKFI